MFSSGISRIRVRAPSSACIASQIARAGRQGYGRSAKSTARPIEAAMALRWSSASKQWKRAS